MHERLRDSLAGVGFMYAWELCQNQRKSDERVSLAMNATRHNRSVARKERQDRPCSAIVPIVRVC
jgi:hypothetical protein